jgi:hypothetical protein
MHTTTFVMAGLLAIGASACGGVEPDDGPLGAAEQTQIDPGNKDYVIYAVFNDAGLQLGSVLVTATAGDGYDANREYWYLTTNLSNSSAVTFTGGASESWSTPPSGLGTLSFTMNRTPTWRAGNIMATVPVYSNPTTGEFDAVNWGMSESGGVWTGSITWWHDSTANMFGPGVTRRLAPTIEKGAAAYYYAQTPL